MLGECDAGLAANATCSLAVDGKSGQLSECLKEGVSNGTALVGIWAGTGKHGGRNGICVSILSST